MKNLTINNYVMKKIYFSMTKQYKLIFDVSETRTFCSDDTAVLLCNSSKVKNQNESTPTPEFNYWGKKKNLFSLGENFLFVPRCALRPSHVLLKARCSEEELQHSFPPGRSLLILRPTPPLPPFFFLTASFPRAICHRWWSSWLPVLPSVLTTGVGGRKEVIDDVWISR